MRTKKKKTIDKTKLLADFAKQMEAMIFSLNEEELFLLAPTLLHYAGNIFTTYVGATKSKLIIRDFADNIKVTEDNEKGVLS